MLEPSLFNEDGELLLLQRHSDDLGGAQWGTPGGRIEEGEDAHAAVLREIREETGINLTEATPLGIHEICMPHGTVNMTTFKAVISLDSPVVIDPEEHHAYAWFRLNSLFEKGTILWGIPTMLNDFRLFDYKTDPTLADGSSAVLIERTDN